MIGHRCFIIAIEGIASVVVGYTFIRKKCVLSRCTYMYPNTESSDDVKVG